MISLELFKKNIEIYKNSTGIDVSVIDNEGYIICSTNEKNCYCDLYRKMAGAEGCRKFHIDSGYMSQKYGSPYMSICPGELILWSTPVIINGIISNVLLAGPVLLRPADEMVFDDLDKYGSNENGRRLRDLLNDIPVILPKRARYLSELLMILAEHLTSEGMVELNNNREYYEAQAKIAEEIEDMKNSDDEHISVYYPLEKERLLVKLVREGDKIKSKKILNELLGHVFFKSGGNFEYMKARVLELVVVLSRAAVEGGADLEMIFGLNYKYLHEVEGLNNVDELCFWLIKVLDRFTECVYSIGKVTAKNSLIVHNAIEYIKKNYDRNITLEDISQAVYLSPNYFSKLFKDELNLSFVDYLNKVRVEESKKYLADLKLSIIDIALKVGFQDQSYYTRVFKKYEGKSPGQFRKMNWGFIQ